MSEPEKKEKKKHHHKHHHHHHKDGEKKEKKHHHKHHHKDGEKKEKKHHHHHHKRGVNGNDPPAALAGSQTAPLHKVSSSLGEGVIQEPLDKYYVLGRELGTGAFSVVREGTNKKTGQKVAIKIMDKASGDDLVYLRREIANMKKINHPNVVKLYDVFEDATKFYLIIELVQGVELFKKIVDKGQYSEREAAHITRQFVRAIEHIHQHGIVHRDMKPENLLSVGDGKNEVVKVADFGLSKLLGAEKTKTMIGSPGYIAPEVLEGKEYGAEVDMWAVGVILYILLVGYPPFYSENQVVLFRQIINVQYDFNDKGWEDVSDSAKDLIRKLLVKDGAKRLTATQALAHPWLKSEVQSPKQLALANLRNFLSKRENELAKS